jgi:GWxTD domain-containing protein
MVNSGLAQNETPSPRVLFAAEKFYHPEHGAYVELYLSFDALSLEYKQVDDYYQAKLEVLYVIKKGESVIKYQKFEILSPQMSNEKDRQDFADVQKMRLKPGNYTIDVSILDANRDIKPIKAKQNIGISLKEKKMAMSDFMLEKSIVETSSEGPFVKNGLEMTPWLVSTIPAFINDIYLYAEVYNSAYALGPKGAYVERHTLRNLDADSVFAKYSIAKRVNTGEVNVILKHLDLSTLPQGSYSYVIELYNRNNKLMSSNGKQFFRESDIPSLEAKKRIEELANFEMEIRATTTRDSIVDFVRCVWPLATRSEQNFIHNNWKTASTEVLQSFLISFWSDLKPENTLKEWKKYRAMVAVVNEEFGSAAKPGYDTDQGMTYLKYGPPDQITDRANEPSSYPYIIWQYYAHPMTSNAMYVFYDPLLTYRDYQLLHSNVRGEKNNERWRLVLQSRNNANGDVDKDRGEDHWGGQVDDYYTNPR